MPTRLLYKTGQMTNLQSSFLQGLYKSLWSGNTSSIQYSLSYAQGSLGFYSIAQDFSGISPSTKPVLPILKTYNGLFLLELSNNYPSILCKTNQ